MTQFESQSLYSDHSAQGIIVSVARSDTALPFQHLLTVKLAPVGYESMNLDVMVPAKSIVNQVRNARARALVLCVERTQDRNLVEGIMKALRVQGFSLPVLMLGEAVNADYAQRVALPENGELYRGGVYYCESSDEVLQVLKQIILFTPAPANHEHEHEEESVSSNSCSACSGCGEDCALSAVVGNGAASKPPSPPFWGYRTELDVPWDAVLELLDTQQLMVRWMATVQYSPAPGYWQDFDVALSAMLHQLTLQLKPRVLYGYFPVQSDGNTLVLYDYKDPVMRCAVGRLTLPRIGQPDASFPARSFSSVDSQCIDVLPIQVVTFESDLFDETQFCFGNVSWLPMMQAAVLNALRAWVMQRIRVDLSMPASRGILISWENKTVERGADYKVLFDILPMRDALDLALTASGDVTPVYTSIAFFIHSMDAYFMAI